MTTPTSPGTGSSHRSAIVVFGYDFFQSLSSKVAQRPALTNFGGEVTNLQGAQHHSGSQSPTFGDGFLLELRRRLNDDRNVNNRSS